MARFRMNVGAESLLVDTSTMLLSEAEKCEALTGWTASEWVDNLLQDRARAVKFAYWLARQRSGDAIDFAAIDFDLGAVDWQLDDDEQQQSVEPPNELGVSDGDDLPTSPEQTLGLHESQ